MRIVFIISLATLLSTGCTQTKVNEVSYKAGKAARDVVDGASDAYHATVNGVANAYHSAKDGYHDQKDEEAGNEANTTKYQGGYKDESAEDDYY